MVFSRASYAGNEVVMVAAGKRESMAEKKVLGIARVSNTKHGKWDAG